MALLVLIVKMIILMMMMMMTKLTRKTTMAVIGTNHHGDGFFYGNQMVFQPEFFYTLSFPRSLSCIHNWDGPLFI